MLAVWACMSHVAGFCLLFGLALSSVFQLQNILYQTLVVVSGLHDIAFYSTHCLSTLIVITCVHRALARLLCEYISYRGGMTAMERCSLTFSYRP